LPAGRPAKTGRARGQYTAATSLARNIQGCSGFGLLQNKLTPSRERAMLIQVIIVLIIVGVLLWLVNNYIPMDGKIKSILNVVVIIVVVLWLLQAFGLLSGVGI
jgi:magnesium-transporting ATPase (P-type)